MNTIAIICEYNPFHYGHAAQLARLREISPGCAIVCIMSGNFTQRGEPALMPDYDRARAAVLCGADLVLELPQPWASGSAEFFAASGVSIADRLGGIDFLAFGCETDDPAASIRVAERIDSPGFRAALPGAPDDPGEGAAARADGFIGSGSAATMKCCDSRITFWPSNIALRCDVLVRGLHRFR